MNIFDCFMYFDEDMLLDLRLHMLNKYIKKFIIVESTFLHNGKPKKLNFDLNKFYKFKDKIEYIVVDSLPSDIKNINLKDSKNIKNSKILINALKRENYQRNMISKGFKEINDDDLIIISDVDEIPNLKDFRYKKKFSFFKQKMFYYKFKNLFISSSLYKFFKILGDPSELFIFSINSLIFKPYFIFMFIFN